MRYVIRLCLIILAVSISSLASANETDFDQWLIDLRKEANHFWDFRKSFGRSPRQCQADQTGN